MKRHSILNALTLVLLTTFSGCELIGGIFRIGMGIGIFITVLVVVFIYYVINRFFKK